MDQIKIYKYPALLLAIAFSIGIICARFFPLYPVSLWIAGLILLISLFFSGRFQTNVRNALLIALLCSCGAIHYQSVADVLDDDHIRYFNRQKIRQVQGLISDYYYQHDGRDKYLLEVEKIFTDSLTYDASGTILVRVDKFRQRFIYGDIIRLTGSLKKALPRRNPGQFDYQSYLADHHIYFLTQVNAPGQIELLQRKQGNLFIQHLIIPIRQYLVETFNYYMNEETRAIINALILGEKQNLEAETVSAFQRVGVVHVLAISGLHVGFIITFVFSSVSLLRFNRLHKIWILCLVLVFYIIMVRFKIPVIRSATMALLYLISRVLERKVSIYNVIFSSMLVILIIDPRELFRPGFQFSFSAVLSIIYGYQMLDHHLSLKRFLSENVRRSTWIQLLNKMIRIPFLVSLSAVLGTAPLSLFYYGQFPTYAILANLFVIPIIGLMVFMSIFMLIFSFISYFITSGCAQIITFLFKLLKIVVNYIAELPGATIFTSFPTPLQVLGLFILILFVLNIRFDRHLFFRISIVCCITTLIFVSLRTENDLEVSFLDVGQGDAVFIRFPNSRTMLVDGGNTSKYWDDGQRAIVPFLQSVSSMRINYLIASHPHHDHIGGFAYLLKNVTIDTLVLTRYQYRSRFYQMILKTAATKNNPIKYVFRGCQLKIDPDCRVYILHPDSIFSQARSHQGAECNNSSIVMKIQYGKNGILLTGDLEQTGEIPVMDYGDFLESEILKVGHHGSITSTSSAFLNRVNPLVAIISVGEKNKFNHPSLKTLRRLQQESVTTYMTSQNGALVFRVRPLAITKVAWR